MKKEKIGVAKVRFEKNRYSEIADTMIGGKCPVTLILTGPLEG